MNFVLLFAFLGGSLLTGCGVDLSNPPRLATATAQAATSPTPLPAPLVLPAPTSTRSGTAEPPLNPSAVDELLSDTALNSDGLTIWVDEVSPEHQVLLDTLAANFADRNGVNVAVQLISPALLP